MESSLLWNIWREADHPLEVGGHPQQGRGPAWPLAQVGRSVTEAFWGQRQALESCWAGSGGRPELLSSRITGRGCRPSPSPRCARLGTLNKFSSRRPVSRGWTFPSSPSWLPFIANSFSSRPWKGVLSRLHPISFPPINAVSSMAGAAERVSPHQAPDRTVFRAEDVDEPVCVSACSHCSLDRCLSELSIRMTAACQAVCSTQLARQGKSGEIHLLVQSLAQWTDYVWNAILISHPTCMHWKPFPLGFQCYIDGSPGAENYSQ